MVPGPAETQQLTTFPDTALEMLEIKTFQLSRSLYIMADCTKGLSQPVSSGKQHRTQKVSCNPMKRNKAKRQCGSF